LLLPQLERAPYEKYGLKKEPSKNKNTLSGFLVSENRTRRTEPKLTVHEGLDEPWNLANKYDIFPEAINPLDEMTVR
jgi:hypothetical protein